MPHAHASTARVHQRRLLAVFAITLAVFVVELIGGMVANSLALPADAGHLFTDVAGIGLALLAIWFAERPVNPAVLDELCRCLSGDFDIEHSTFQLETSDRRRLGEVGHA